MTSEDDKRFAITWKIKNFSYCFYGERQTIDSPEFYAENVRRTKWILQISQEYGLVSHFTVIIKRAEEDYGPASVKLNLQISVLSNKGLTLRRESVENTEFSKGTKKGSLRLLERAVLFATRKEEYLPQDTLTIHCQFWEVGTTTTETERVFVRSEIEVDRKFFLGTVSNFSQINARDSREVQLKMLSSEDESSLFIPDRANLSVIERAEYEETLELHIYFKDNAGEFFSCKICVFDVEGQKLNCGKFDFSYEEYGPRTLQCGLLPTRWDLMAKESLYLPVDTLTLHCEFIIATGNVLDLIKTLLSEEHRDLHAECSSSASVLDDFKNVYSYGVLCDVDLQTVLFKFGARRTGLLLGESQEVWGK
ncbi:TD and POZ domain-containing protein 5 [Caerostris darwini]|uniref:TD and POZ domain-containing protein 5 n=1 Tax=Caerostris darwini TaxID=1538125 RepID=A0AAV4VG26_9ARAC|nr:TD and POZ domain-containing protein 5 [Caerostris darwini]